MKRIKRMAILLLLSVMSAGFLTGCSINIGSSFGANVGNYTAGNGEIMDKIESIDMEWASGSVTVVEGKENKISIIEECSEELDDSYMVQWWVDGTTLRIRYDNVVGFLRFNFFSPEKHLTVTIPENIEFKNFDLSVASADISMERITANEVNIDTASGDIEVRELNGSDVNIDSASGDIEVKELNGGDVSIDSASGKTDIEKITADEVDIDSASGNIEIEKAECKRLTADAASGNIKAAFNNIPDYIDAESASGNITITLPENAEFTADIDTASGKLHCDFPAEHEYDKHDKDKIIVGSGTAKISIDTASGDVNIYMDK